MIHYKLNVKVRGEEVRDLREIIGWKPLGRYYRQNDYLERSFYYVGCFDDSQLIGFIQVISNGLSDAYVQDLMVHPEYRRQGIAAKMMKEVLRYLDEKQIYAVSVIFTPELEAFYRSFGFTIQMGGRLCRKAEPSMKGGLEAALFDISSPCCPWKKAEGKPHACVEKGMTCTFFNGMEKDRILCGYHHADKNAPTKQTKQKLPDDRSAVLYMAVSLDGYIADEQGGVSWLEQFGSVDDMESYQNFYNSIDTIIMGRVSYDQIENELAVGKWPYENKKVFVASKKMMGKNKHVTYINYEVPEFIEFLKHQEGKRIWIFGGAQLVNLCMEADVIDEYHITVLPVLLGKGIPLFSPLSRKMDLELIASESSNHLTTLQYRRKK